MNRREDPNPFDEEVNPCSNGSAGPGSKSRIPQMVASTLGFGQKHDATVDIPLDSTNDPKKKEKELSNWEADLKRRERDIKRREEAVAGDDRNWPPSFPIIHHDITNEIPVHAQKLQYLAFASCLEMANEGNQGNRSPVDEAADEALIPARNFAHLQGNNFHVDLIRFRTQHQVMVDILRQHPVYYALTTTVTVPEIYLQQFWLTVDLATRNCVETVIATIDRTELSLNLDEFRLILHLPQATDGGRVAFEPLLDDAAMLSDIRSLGYTRGLTMPSQFRRGQLQPLWSTLFTILNRCLSSKTKGVDQCTTNFLHLFHAVAFGRHVDFASLLWFDFTRDMRGIGGHNTIPFMRFIQIIIHAHMANTPNVRRRSSNRSVPQNAMGYIHAREAFPGVPVGRIPDAVLNLADPGTPSVRSYRESVGLGVACTDRPEPAGPSQRAQPERIGRRTMGRGSRPARGAASTGTLRVTARDACLGSVVGVSESAHRPLRTPTDIDGPSRIVRTPTPPASPQRGDTPPIHQSPIRRAGEATNDAPQEPLGGSSDGSFSSNEDSGSGSDDPGSGGELESESGGKQTSSEDEGDVRVVSEPEKTEVVEVQEEDVEEEIPSLEDLALARRFRPFSIDGVVFYARRSKSTPIPRAALTTSTRVATSTVDSHLLRADIETDTVRPTVHLHASPSHSTASQQAVASSSHGDLAQSLPTSHSEMAGIETREQPLPLSLPFSAPFVDPLASTFDRSSFARTLLEGTTASSLSGFAGTVIASAPPSVMQGLTGSPVTVNPLPAVSTCGFSAFAVVGTSLGSQSGPRVSPPEFVSKEFLDGALKAVQGEIRREMDERLREEREATRAEMDELRRLIKGKGKATEAEPTPIIPASSPVTIAQPRTDPVTDLSANELKALLLYRLLQDADITSELEIDLVGLLRIQTSQPAPAPDTEALLEQLRQKDKEIKQLKAQVADLQATCRAQAQGTKRGHDDQDNPDRHEGKKRRCTDSAVETLH